MRKILIFGNSGSGKSTIAKKLAESERIPHLDLDTLAWQPVTPPERFPLTHSKKKIEEFTSVNEHWVIEGCYTDLLEVLAQEASEIIFMNLDVELCTKNAKNRPWEPHKYESKKAQDQNLEMLITWIEKYMERTDVFSHVAHMKFYMNFPGKKKMITRNSALDI